MREFLKRHYEFELDVFHIALVAFLIFFMNLFVRVQIGLVIAVALVFIWMFHALRKDEPPCGAGLEEQPVARSRGSLHP